MISYVYIYNIISYNLHNSCFWFGIREVHEVLFRLGVQHDSCIGALSRARSLSLSHSLSFSLSLSLSFSLSLSLSLSLSVSLSFSIAACIRLPCQDGRLASQTQTSSLAYRRIRPATRRRSNPRDGRSTLSAPGTAPAQYQRAGQWAKPKASSHGHVLSLSSASCLCFFCLSFGGKSV